MKKSLIALFAFVTLTSAQAGDPCQDSIFRLHDTLTSKTAIQTIAAFSAVMLIDKLNQTDMEKGVSAAYNSSAEEKDHGDAFRTAVVATQKACVSKSMACKSKINEFVNTINTPVNDFAKSVAVNELVKLMNDASLFTASQKNLSEQGTRFSNSVSAALDPALAACK
jgi:hypothetical protein